MKKVTVLILILFLYGCQSREEIEKEINQKVAKREVQVKDSLRIIYDAELKARELVLQVEIDSVSQLLTAKSPQLQGYQSQIRDYKSTISQLNAQIKTLSAEDPSLDSLSGALSKLAKEKQVLEQEKGKYLDQIKSLEAANKSLKAEVTRLKKNAPKPDIKKSLYKVTGNTASKLSSEEGRGFVAYKVDPQKSDVRLFWRDDNKELYDNFLNYRNALDAKGELLLFATNGGMYQPDQSPQGLYIENGKTLQKADTKREGYGNFYMQPNGIFLITDDGTPYVIKTQDLRTYQRKGIRYATQSGPMLLTNGKMNAKFMKDSPNFHIRSGVGVDAEGKLVFIISETRVRFYELAKAFEAMGCANALYLDGAISQTYLPEVERLQTGGGFGVMIGVSKKK